MLETDENCKFVKCVKEAISLTFNFTSEQPGVELLGTKRTKTVPTTIVKRSGFRSSQGNGVWKWNSNPHPTVRAAEESESMEVLEASMTRRLMLGHYDVVRYREPRPEINTTSQGHTAL